MSNREIISILLRMTKKELKEFAEDLSWYGPATSEVLEFQLAVSLQERQAELEEQDRRA
jgi:hypothetical protein